MPAALSAMCTAAGKAACRFPRPAAVVAAAVLLAAVMVPAAASAAGPASARPPVPVLHWRSCDGGFQCAAVRVPLSYRHPRGATIRIAVVRHLATDPARRIGTLFINSGGPGVQIEPFVDGFGDLPAAIAARYDIITFDPRGFGYSTAVRCFPTMAAESKFLGGLPAFPVGARQDAAWVRTWARFDARCAARGGRLLRHDTTANVARDMNLLRQAVGAPVLNYLGVSYGTGLGATYANLFPATTGHMVLDANLNPVAWTHPDGVLPTFLRQGSDQASAAVMRDFLDLCGQTTTSACAFSAGTPAATRAKWATLLRRLRRHPVTIGTPPQTYTYADAVASRASQRGEPVAVRRQPAAAALDGLGRPPLRPRRHAPASSAPPRRRVHGRLHRRGADVRRALLGQPEPARPGRLRGRRASRLCPRRAPSACSRPGAWRRARTGPPLRPRTVTQVRGTGPRPAPSWSSATPATRSCPTRTRSQWPGTWPARGC